MLEDPLILHTIQTIANFTTSKVSNYINILFEHLN